VSPALPVADSAADPNHEPGGLIPRHQTPAQVARSNHQLSEVEDGAAEPVQLRHGEDVALAAADLTAWTQAPCFTGALLRLEPKRLRYRVLHVAGRLVHIGRRQILRLDQNWPWASDLAAAFNRLRTAPWPG
jgi:hypothetical protein